MICFKLFYTVRRVKDRLAGCLLTSPIAKGLIYNQNNMLNRLRRLVAPPIFDNEEKTRVARFLFIFSWIGIGVILLAIAFRLGSWTEANNFRSLILLTLIPILFLMQFMLRLGYVQVTSILVTLITWGILTYLAAFENGVRDTAVVAYILVILLSVIFLKSYFVLLFSLMSILSIWYFAVMEEQGVRPLRIDHPFNYAWDLTSIVMLISILTYLVLNGWLRSLQSARLELRERLRAEERLQKQAEYLTALHETALGLVNRLELHPLLESIITRASELLETPHVALHLVLPDESALKQELGLGIFVQFDEIITHENYGVVGTAWATGETVFVKRYGEWEGRIPEVTDMGFEAVVGTPLKSGNKIVGILVVAHLEKDKEFTDQQVMLLERFATLAALAIQNTRLHEQAQTELNERRIVELALRASEERFRKVFETGQMAICIASLDEGRFIDANDAFWKLSGLRPETTIGQTAVELGMWENPDARNAFVVEMLQKRSLKNVEVQFPTPGGEKRDSLAFYELIQLEDEQCVLAMFYDITEQKQAQEALRDAEARTRALLTAMPDMIFEISKEGIFKGYIPSSEIGPLVPPEQFLGKNIKELFPPRIAEQTMFALERALETNQLHAFEYGMPPGEEMQFFEARVSAISSELAMIMVRDISQRKWIETEREKLIQELEDKNAELERFTYTVSHDLKSPLITIKGFLGFIEQDASNGNILRLKADIKRIGDATDKMQLLLNELLELSRIGRLKNVYEEISFEDIAREAVELVQGRLLKAHAKVRIQENMPKIHGDHPRLLEVLQNLVDNAAKFIGSQARPRIEIGQKGEEDDKPIFFVRDNGIGIEPEHQDRIFGLFNKLDADTEGTGIGLTLVKRIVEIHGGRIWVESQAGKGSTFFFTLRTEPEF